MKVLVSVICFLFLGSAFAQKNMVELGSSALTSGSMRVRTDETQNSAFAISGSYAYQFSTRQQLALRGNYLYENYKFGSADTKSLQAGIIHNFQDELSDSLYASLYAGYKWDHGTYTTFSEEYFQYSVSFGKRFSLEKLGLKNLSYSPEITWNWLEGTTSSAEYDYLEIKYLQFSFSSKLDSLSPT